MALEGEGYKAARELVAIGDEFRGPLQCEHEGGHEAMHKDAVEWCREWAQRLEDNPGMLRGPARDVTMDDMRAEAHARFPGCALATPLVVMVHYVALAIPRREPILKI